MLESPYVALERWEKSRSCLQASVHTGQVGTAYKKLSMLLTVAVIPHVKLLAFCNLEGPSLSAAGDPFNIPCCACGLTEEEPCQARVASSISVFCAAATCVSFSAEKGIFVSSYLYYTRLSQGEENQTLGAVSEKRALMGH